MSDSEFSQKPIVFIRHYSFTSRAVTLWIADSILAAIFCKAVGVSKIMPFGTTEEVVPKSACRRRRPFGPRRVRLGNT